MSISLKPTILFLVLVVSTFSLPLRQPRARGSRGCLSTLSDLHGLSCLSVSQIQDLSCLQESLRGAIDRIHPEDINDQYLYPDESNLPLFLISYVQRLLMTPNFTDVVDQAIVLQLNDTLYSTISGCTNTDLETVDVIEEYCQAPSCLVQIIEALFTQFMRNSFDSIPKNCMVCKRLKDVTPCNLTGYKESLEVINRNESQLLDECHFEFEGSEDNVHCKVDPSLNYLGQTLVIEQAIAALLNGSYNVSEEVIQILTRANDSLPAIRDSLEKECECTCDCKYDTNTQVDTINELLCTETGKRLCLVNVITLYFNDLYRHLEEQSIIPYLELEGGECITAQSPRSRSL